MLHLFRCSDASTQSGRTGLDFLRSRYDTDQFPRAFRLFLEQTLAEYPIGNGELVGSGNQAQVYRLPAEAARALGNGPMVKKTFLKINPEALMEIFIRIRLGLHPGLLKMHCWGLDPDGSLFYTMPYVDSYHFDDYAWVPPTPFAAISRFIEIVEVFAYIHHKGVVVRDVKPENVLVGSWRPYVVDFGSSLIQGMTLPHQHGLFYGNLKFASPEHFENDPTVLMPSSDLFGLGLMLYEVLRWQVDPEESTIAPLPTMGNLILAGKSESLRALVRHYQVPWAIARILLRCLRKKMDIRYRLYDEKPYLNAEELLGDLRAISKPELFGFLRWWRSFQS